VTVLFNYDFFSRWALSMLLVLSGSLSTASMAGDSLPPEVGELRAAWDEANFVLQGDTQKHAMLELVEQCAPLLEKLVENQSALTWCGIVKSSYAGHAGALSAMKYAKSARSDLEAALKLGEGELAGAANTSLGTLYFKVPGWPIGFGNEDKAKEFLEAGLTANPEDMDANFFMADFLNEEGELEAARSYLKLAAAAASKPGREIAYKGRQDEIAVMLESIDKKLAK
jgi:tetratricopeptide (TPR) repeat protein